MFPWRFVHFDRENTQKKRQNQSIATKKINNRKNHIYDLMKLKKYNSDLLDSGTHWLKMSISYINRFIGMKSVLVSFLLCESRDRKESTNIIKCSVKRTQSKRFRAKSIFLAKFESATEST